MRQETEAFPGAGDLRTPTVALDATRLDRNLRRMGEILPRSVALHPHIKTHKSLEIARLQMERGAAGLTASKPAEAMVFLRAGLGPVTVAFPIVAPGEASKVLGAASKGGVAARFIADSPVGVEALAAGARAAGASQVPVFLKVDVGLRRCGVDPASPDAMTIAADLARRKELAFAGLLSHAGNAYGAKDAAGVRATAERELDILTTFRRRLEAGGLAVPVLSVGSTPTVLAHAGFDGVGEVRPGNYVFLDLTAVRVGVASRDEIALAVVTTIVSMNSQYAIIDAGSKTLSSDFGAHGAAGSTYGEAYLLHDLSAAPLQVVRLSEEHGFVERTGTKLEIGMKFLVLPNHACPVANLARSLVLLSKEAVRTVTVDARSSTPQLTSEAAGEAS